MREMTKQEIIEKIIKKAMDDLLMQDAKCSFIISSKASKYSSEEYYTIEALPPVRHSVAFARTVELSDQSNGRETLCFMNPNGKRAKNAVFSCKDGDMYLNGQKICDAKEYFEETTVWHVACSKKLYQFYQLDWMMSHGYTLDAYVQLLAEADEDARANGEYPEGGCFDVMESLASVAEDIGFGGNIWVCFEEFLESEFRDPAYMKHLFSNIGRPDTKEELLDAWKEITGLYLPEDVMEAETSAGTIKAYKSSDPGQPGIFTMLQPKDMDEEIDLAFACTYEDKDYATSEGEEPEDVVIFAYGDAYTEDYTSKNILRGKDIKEALK